MKLILSITSYHRFTSNIEEVKIVDSTSGDASITIGRSENCSWYLPDPERVISSRHARVEISGNNFLLYDTSTNGIFINNSVKPINKVEAYRLCDGDQITIGDYEISVNLSEHTNTTDSYTLVQEHVANDSENVLFSEEFGIPLDANVDDIFSPPEQQSSGVEIPENWDAVFSTQKVNKVVEDEVVVTQDSEDKNAYSDQHFTSNNELIHLQAFLDGMGISEKLVSQEDPTLWWNQLGVVTRDLLDGIMNSLHNRSVFKENSRINKTTFQRSENNPLKFSVNAEDAIHNLLQRKNAGFLPPEKAVKQAFNDLEMHEESMLAGVKGAVNGVISILNPETVVAQDSQEGFFSVIKSNRQWNYYRKTYQNIRNEFESDNDFFMDDFSKAYEAKLKNAD